MWFMLAGLTVLGLSLFKMPDDSVKPDGSPPASALPPDDPQFDREWKTGEMILAVGASQSGKTYWVKSQIKDAKRLLIWDIEGQYTDIAREVNSLAELARLIRSNPREGRFAFQAKVNAKEFEVFCRLAMAFCEAGIYRRENGEPMRTYVVVEELADVTSPGKAPAGWGELVRRGLKRHMFLYGITQRPSESDKTILGNCSQIHCCRVQRYEDAQYMARQLSIPVEKIAALNGEHKQFVHKWCTTGRTEWGGIVKPHHT